MQLYTLFWLDGKKEVVKGTSIKDAFARAGYGVATINALDFYSDAEDGWVWDKQKKTWKSKR